MDALAEGFVDLLLCGRHLALRLEAADDHFARAETDGAARDVEGLDDGEVSLQVLLDAAARRGPRHVERHVAAADHDDARSHFDLVAEVDVQEVVDPFQDAIQVHPGNREAAALHRADSEEDRGEALRPQVG